MHNRFEYESSFKNPIFYPLQTDLIFINQIPFFLSFTKQICFFINQISFFSTLQNRSDFSLRREHIHKMKLFKLILSNKVFVTCITTYHSMSYKKGI